MLFKITKFSFVLISFKFSFWYLNLKFWYLHFYMELYRCILSHRTVELSWFVLTRSVSWLLRSMKLPHLVKSLRNLPPFHLPTHPFGPRNPLGSPTDIHYSLKNIRVTLVHPSEVKSQLQANRPEKTARLLQSRASAGYTINLSLPIHSQS